MSKPIQDECELDVHYIDALEDYVSEQEATITELRQGIQDHIVWAERVIDCDDLKELIGED